jgi:hypothetical protein
MPVILVTLSHGSPTNYPSLGYGMDDRKIVVLLSENARNFALKRSRLALGPTQPSIQWVPGSFASGVRRTGREFDHSPPSGAEVKNEWSYTSAPSIRLLVGKNLLALYWSLSSTTITITTTTHRNLLRYHWYSINPALYGENFDLVG